MPSVRSIPSTKRSIIIQPKNVTPSTKKSTNAVSRLSAAPRDNSEKNQQSRLQSRVQSTLQLADNNTAESPSMSIPMSSLSQLKKTDRGNLDSEDGSNTTLATSGIAIIPEIPRTFFHLVDVPYNIKMNKDPDIKFSNSMVIRAIGRNSVLLPYLLVGDQVVEINGKAILSAEEFFAHFSESYDDEVSGIIRVVRVWNNTNCGNRLPAKRSKDFNYLVVEMYRFPGFTNGFKIMKASPKYCEVTELKMGHRAHHAFILKDRIIDVDGIPMVEFDSANDVRKKFNDILTKRLMCSFLVERHLSLNNTPNSSLQAALAYEGSIEKGKNSQEKEEKEKPREKKVEQDKAEKKKDEKISIKMGVDSVEIGAREATRFIMMSDRLQPKPINGERDKTYKETELCSKKKSTSYEGRRNRISQIPTDVKDGKKLQKVTAKSGIISFVRSYLNK